MGALTLIEKAISGSRPAMRPFGNIVGTFIIIHLSE